MASSEPLDAPVPFHSSEYNGWSKPIIACPQLITEQREEEHGIDFSALMSNGTMPNDTEKTTLSSDPYGTAIQLGVSYFSFLRFL